MNIYEQISSNKNRSMLIIACFAVLFFLLGLGFDYFYGNPFPVYTLVSVAAAAFYGAGGYFYGDKAVLYSAGARPLDTGDPLQKQWQNILEEMSIAAGIPVPRAYFIDDADPNAFATGRNPENSSIAVTRGLLENLNREELQGVAAHEMSHIRNYDIRLMLVVSVILGAIALLTDWSMRGFHNRANRRDRQGSGGIILLLIWLIAVILAPIVSRLIAMFVSRTREYLADASGAELTRNPLGLASALAKIAAHNQPTRAINQGNAHMFISDPKRDVMGFKEGWVADLLATHPPIQKRIEALRQMGYQAA